MDAVKFLKERERACNEYIAIKKCGDCPLATANRSCNSLIKEHPEKAVEAIEKWSADHPIKTCQNEALKLFPNLEVDDKGVAWLFPCNVDFNAKDERCNKYEECRNCRRDYWMEEIK